jgi:hypothetical protein
LFGRILTHCVWWWAVQGLMGMAGYSLPANGNGRAALPNAHNISPESQKSPESITMTGMHSPSCTHCGTYMLLNCSKPRLINLHNQPKQAFANCLN